MAGSIRCVKKAMADVIAMCCTEHMDMSVRYDHRLVHTLHLHLPTDILDYICTPADFLHNPRFSA